MNLEPAIRRRTMNAAVAIIVGKLLGATAASAADLAVLPRDATGKHDDGGKDLAEAWRAPSLDDGAVVCLNGSEAFRRGIDGEARSRTRRARSSRRRRGPSSCPHRLCGKNATVVAQAGAKTSCGFSWYPSTASGASDLQAVRRTGAVADFSRPAAPTGIPRWRPSAGPDGILTLRGYPPPR